MSETHTVTDLVKPTSGLKTFAKRTALVAVAATVVAAIYVKRSQNDNEDGTETPQA